MTTLNVKDSKGASAGTVELSDEVFAIEPNINAVRQTLLAYQANQRQGTHSTKTRAFVSGGGRKPWKQKGTGRARQGSIRAPQWRGGAIIFGPSPRDYRQKINKKVRRLALYSALSDLKAKNQIVVLDKFEIAQPKTKEFVSLLKTLEIEAGQRILVLVSGKDEVLERSSRNLPYVLVSDVTNVNIFNLLTCDYLIATSETLKALEKQITAEEKAA